MTLDASAQNNRIITLYEQHVNPGLVKLLKFMGLETTEYRGRGAIVEDTVGGKFIDCLGGFGSLNFGHAHPRIIEAVHKQLDLMPLSTKLLFNKPQGELAERLAEITPGDLQFSFFCHSGAEAVEGAIKFARLATGKRKIIAANDAYHGKTLGALSASGRNVYKSPFQPLLDWFTHVPFGDAEALSASVDNDTAAVLLEPIQGEAGVIIPDDDYLPKARAVCDAAGALLIADEVQTGLGRTGRDFGIEWYDVSPDLMTLAKSLGGGVIPLGAVMGTERVFAPLSNNPLLHSSTLGGNPLACTAGCTALEVLRDEKLSARATELGAPFVKRLRDIAATHRTLITDVRAQGLMIGVEFNDEDTAGLTIAGLIQRKILAAYTLNNPKVIRFEPPLVIDEAQLRQASDAFAEAVTGTAEMINALSEA